MHSVFWICSICPTFQIHVAQCIGFLRCFPVRTGPGMKVANGLSMSLVGGGPVRRSHQPAWFLMFCGFRKRTNANAYQSAFCFRIWGSSARKLGGSNSGQQMELKHFLLNAIQNDRWHSVRGVWVTMAGSPFGSKI